MRTEQIYSTEFRDSTNAESDRVRMTDQDFEKLLIKERLKLNLFPLFINFQSFFTSMQFNIDDQKVPEMQKSMLLLDKKNNSILSTPETSHKTAEQKNNTGSSAPAQQVNSKTAMHMEQTKRAEDKLNNVFLVNLKLSTDFQDMLVQAKSRIASIKNVGLDDLIAEIVDKARVIKENGRTELLLKLKPDELGEILLSIVKDKGSLSITIFANQKTHDLFEQSIAELEKSLKGADLNISGLQVSVSNKGSQGFTGNSEEDLGVQTIGPLLYNKPVPVTAHMDSGLIERALGLGSLSIIFSNA